MRPLCRRRTIIHGTTGLTEQAKVTSSDADESWRITAKSRSRLMEGRKQSGTRDLIRVLKRPLLGATKEQLEEADASGFRRVALAWAGRLHDDDPSEEKREVRRPEGRRHQRDWRGGSASGDRAEAVSEAE